MYDAEKLLKKLHELEKLIQSKTNSDGSCDFDAESIFISLEIARKMLEKG